MPAGTVPETVRATPRVAVPDGFTTAEETLRSLACAIDPQLSHNSPAKDKATLEALIVIATRLLRARQAITPLPVCLSMVFLVGERGRRRRKLSCLAPSYCIKDYRVP